MFTRRIRFDRVFGRHRIVRGRSTVTGFGFEADGRKVLEARIAGDHDVPVGVDLTVALKHEDAWTTLLGWVDHSTGRMVCQSPASAILLAVLSAIPLSVFGALAFGAAHGARWLFLCAMALVALVIAVAMIRDAWFVLGAHRFLSASRARAENPAAPTP
jgi:hypothetical protein